jgi:hypothetical protein
MRIGGEDRGKKFVVILLLLACCCASFYFYWTTLRMIESDTYEIENARSASIQPDPAAEAEKNEIAEAEAGLNGLTSSASQAMREALYAETSGKYPLDVPNSLVVTYSAAASPAAEIAVEPDPPSVKALAVLQTDKGFSAMVEVDGVKKIVRPNDSKSFKESNITILKIDQEGVDYRWMRKKPSRADLNIRQGSKR